MVGLVITLSRRSESGVNAACDGTHEMAAAFSLGGSLLEAEDVLEAVIEKMHAAALCQLKAASVAWGAHVRRELCKRLWVRLCQREGQPEPAGVDSITDLDVECLNK